MTTPTPDVTAPVRMPSHVCSCRSAVVAPPVTPPAPAVAVASLTAVAGVPRGNPPDENVPFGAIVFTVTEFA